MIKTLFWVFMGIILYVYFGYPLLLITLSNFIKRPIKEGDVEPSVSMIIAAYNEEKSIRRKIENTLVLDYPKDKLEIIVASDGSTDGTNETIRNFEGKGVNLIFEKEHGGKSFIQNRAVEEAKGEIIVFSDATTMCEKDALKKLVRNFADLKVGCVTGKAVYVNPKESATGEGESLYWRYELSLRKLESDLGILAMGSGCFFGIRKSLFRTLDANVSDDFVLPLSAVRNCKRVIYESEAVVWDTVVTTSAGLLKTKARTIGMDIKGLFLFKDLLNPFNYFGVTWSLISHKLLRWVVPYFLVVIFVVNLFLLKGVLYRISFGFQTAFYLLAGLGWWHQKNERRSRILGIPFSFCVVNAAALLGTARYFLGKASGKWEPIR